MAEVAARATAERFRVMKPSATVENTERIRAARASGRRILGLSSGDPRHCDRPPDHRGGGACNAERQDALLCAGRRAQSQGCDRKARSGTIRRALRFSRTFW